VSNSLNPLTFISETITQITYYRQQIKMLETQQLQINRQAELCHHQIDAALTMKLQVLEVQRNALYAKLHIAADELQSVRLEKQHLHHCMGELTKSICNSQLSSEEKKISYSSLALLTDLLKATGSESIVKLDLLMKATQCTPEMLPSSHFNLPFQGE
jgi:chromosome segregation ATPase